MDIDVLSASSSKYRVTKGIVLAFVSCVDKQVLGCTCLHNKAFENTVGKGEIVHKEQILLLPTVHSTY